MGCAAGVHVVAETPDAAAELANRAVERVRQLERRWSRFRPGSELNRLNAASGAPTVVSTDTARLVARMVDAWEATAGRFDPTLLDALEQSGYTQSWTDGLGLVASDGQRTPGRRCIGFTADPETGLVVLPAGVRVEPGGIGKGLAADLVTSELLDAGAAGALVNLGGDVRVRGDDGTDGGGWVIGIEDPHEDTRDVAVVTIADGAVCTSSRLFRRWRTPAGEAHHLLGPSTGQPLGGDVDAVTIVAGEAWWAEALTKAVFVAGAGAAAEVVESGGVCGLLVFSDGAVMRTGPWSEIEATLDITDSEVPS